LAEEKQQEEEVELPFPLAPIVRLIKDNLDEHKLVKREVKEEMDLWLGKMCTKVSKEMNKSPYTTVGLPAFREAIKKYEDIEEFEKEKDRIVATLQKVKLDCDSLIRDLDRKFEVEE
jgi:hypothetical protein